MKDFLKLLAPYLTAIGSAIAVYANFQTKLGVMEYRVGRFKAGAADVAVGIFAGNKRHWGSDSYKVGELVHLSVFV